MKKRYLDFKIDPNFQGVKGLFVLSIENNADRTSTKIFSCYCIKIDYNVMINGRNFFNQKSNNDLRTNFQLVKEIITQLAVY